MNYKILLIALSFTAATSCTTAYKAGQTPDDVYYSPARAIVDKTEDEKNEKYEDLAKQEDQYLKMKVKNRERWGTIDDYDYWYDSRYEHCVCSHRSHNAYSWNNWRYGYGNPYGSYYYNTWHPGYYGGYPIVINKYVPKASNVNRPPLEGYNNKGYNNTNSLGNTIRKVFDNNTSYSNSNQEGSYRTSTPSRTYNPSTSTSSSSSSRTTTSSSSSSGSVSRPSRGN